MLKVSKPGDADKAPSGFFINPIKSCRMNNYILPVIIFFSLAFTFCGNTTNLSQHNTITDKPADTMTTNKITITIDGKPFAFRLANNKTAQELLKVLLVEGSAEVYHDNHYYLTIPKGLPVNGLTATKDAKRGQLVYSDEFKGLGMFFGDGHFNYNEFYYIGEAEGDFSISAKSKKQVHIKVE